MIEDDVVIDGWLTEACYGGGGVGIAPDWFAYTDLRTGRDGTVGAGMDPSRAVT